MVLEIINYDFVSDPRLLYHYFGFDIVYMDRHWVRGLDRCCRLGKPGRLARSQRRQGYGIDVLKPLGDGLSAWRVQCDKFFFYIF